MLRFSSVAIAVICVAFGRPALADLDTFPENDVVVAGETVTLRCSAGPVGLPRVMWVEYALNPQGFAISDGRTVVSSHPNAGRYTITGTGNDFNLQIAATVLADGGRYRCMDANGLPPIGYEGSAQLIVLGSHPICDEWPSIEGVVIEGRRYTSECQVYYQGAFAPNMSWTGPFGHGVTDVTTNSEVWSQASFVASRGHEGTNFVCTTQFLPIGDQPPDHAVNVPTYRSEFPGQPIIVNWGPAPETMYVTPLRPQYEVGDMLVCMADSKPTSRFQWTNMRTLLPEPEGPNFYVTADLLNTNQTMRCNARSTIEGMVYGADIFTNVHVPLPPTSPTTTGPTTTTQPPADGPCYDPRGMWASPNPRGQLCVETDLQGNIFTLIRNGTDLFFVAGRGKTLHGDYRHIGFSAQWPENHVVGTGGFAGECHNCYGNEVLLISGLSRNKRTSDQCGESAGTELTQLYVMTRSGPCIGSDIKVYRPPEQFIKLFNLQPENIITTLP